ncbi:M23 family metallopeptidase [Patescibacteria group bacterium]
MSKTLIIVIIAVILIGGVIWYVSSNKQATNDVAPPTTTSDQGQASANTSIENTNTKSEESVTAAFSTAQVTGLDSNISFTADIPTDWMAEAVSGSQALNIYDPDTADDTTLEKSQIFIKYFSASSFLTLTTVDIKSRTESTINGRPVVTYIIEKKAGVAEFPAQPSWRNIEHRVTDIRSTDDSPTIFYVFGKAPEVSDEVFADFLNSIIFTADESAVTYPMDDFQDRITKKRFGQYITPANSPVQPERFSGYHTAVDLETTELEQNTDVPVYALADGVIKHASTASGYGGVMLIEHIVADDTITAVYGHVRLSSITKNVGDSVTNGERIAYLGTGGTAETGGERMHLHFGLLKGTSINIRGYVASESELGSWYDPAEWLASRQ